MLSARVVSRSLLSASLVRLILHRDEGLSRSPHQGSEGSARPCATSRSEGDSDQFICVGTATAGYAKTFSIISDYILAGVGSPLNL
jgi:hypothetical protein